ncbi:MAG: hypothetical protein ACI9BK_001407, partial [Acidimicrobiales bacterium]
AGAMGAWALNEREAFEDRRDLIAPEAASAPLSS